MVDKKFVYGTLCFDFGQVLPEKISSHAMVFYKYLIKKMVEDEVDLEHDASENLTIPVHWDVASSDSRTRYTAIVEERLKLLRDPDVLIIDMAHNRNSDYQGLASQRTAIEFLCYAVTQFFERDRREDPPLVIIVSHSSFELDIKYDQIKPFHDSGNLVLFNHTGEIQSDDLINIRKFQTNRSAIESSINILEYSRKWIPESVLIENINDKKLKYPGFFALEQADRTKNYTKHYYDASFCMNEISRLIIYHILGEHKEFCNLTVFVHLLNSNWVTKIADSIEAKKLDFFGTESADKIDVRLIDRDAYRNLPEVIGREKLQDVIILVPVIVSGATIQSYIDAISNTQNGASVSVLSILAPSDFNASELNLLDKNNQFSFRNFGNIERHGRLENQNLMMALNHSGESPSYAEESRIPSDRFWLMNLEAGLKPESFPPDHRSAIDYIVDYGASIKNYTNYVVAHISKIASSTASSPVLICVDETDGKGVPKNDDVTIHVCKKYKKLVGDDYIRIPRSALKHFKTGMSKSDFENAYSGQKWVDDLNFLENLDSANVIIFDEFRYSGGTRNRLIGILELYDKKPANYIVYFDFAPGKNSVFDRALYAIDMKK